MTLKNFNVFILILNFLIIELVQSDEMIKIDFISGPYCVDNEISYCLYGNFKHNITDSLNGAKDVNSSYQLFCR